MKSKENEFLYLKELEGSEYLYNERHILGKGSYGHVYKVYKKILNDNLDKS
jgi:hypothetical protein